MFTPATDKEPQYRELPPPTVSVEHAPSTEKSYIPPTNKTYAPPTNKTYAPPKVTEPQYRELPIPNVSVEYAPSTNKTYAPPKVTEPQYRELPIPNVSVEHAPSTDKSYAPPTNKTYAPYKVKKHIPPTIKQHLPPTARTYAPSIVNNHAPTHIVDMYDPPTMNNHAPHIINTYHDPHVNTYTQPNRNAYAPSTRITYSPPTDITYAPSPMKRYAPPPIDTYAPPPINTHAHNDYEDIGHYNDLMDTIESLEAERYSLTDNINRNRALTQERRSRRSQDSARSYTLPMGGASRDHHTPRHAHLDTSVDLRSQSLSKRIEDLYRQINRLNRQSMQQYDEEREFEEYGGGGRVLEDDFYSGRQRRAPRYDQVGYDRIPHPGRYARANSNGSGSGRKNLRQTREHERNRPLPLKPVRDYRQNNVVDDESYSDSFDSDSNNGQDSVDDFLTDEQLEKLVPPLPASLKEPPPPSLKKPQSLEDDAYNLTDKTPSTISQGKTRWNKIKNSIASKLKPVKKVEKKESAEGYFSFYNNM